MNPSFRVPRETPAPRASTPLPPPSSMPPSGAPQTQCMLALVDWHADSPAPSRHPPWQRGRPARRRCPRRGLELWGPIAVPTIVNSVDGTSPQTGVHRRLSPHARSVPLTWEDNQARSRTRPPCAEGLAPPLGATLAHAPLWPPSSGGAPGLRATNTMGSSQQNWCLSFFLSYISALPPSQCWKSYPTNVTLTHKPPHTQAARVAEGCKLHTLVSSLWPALPPNTRHRHRHTHRYCSLPVWLMER